MTPYLVVGTPFHTLLLRVSAPGRATSWQELSSQALPARSVTVPMSAAHRLAGRVRMQGQPAWQARVLAVPGHGSPSEDGHPVVVESLHPFWRLAPERPETLKADVQTMAMCDALGRFRFDDLSSGPYSLMAIDGLGRLSPIVGVVTPADDVMLDVREHGQLRVRLVGPHVPPIAAIRVRGPHAHRSDALQDGMGYWHGLPPGEYRVSVLAEGFAAVGFLDEGRRISVASDEEAVLEIAMQGWVEVSLVLLDLNLEEGGTMPLRNVSVHVGSTAGQTDEEGRVTVSVFSGRHRVFVHHDDRFFWQYVDVRGGEELEVVMKATPRVVEIGGR